MRKTIDKNKKFINRVLLTTMVIFLSIGMETLGILYIYLLYRQNAWINNTVSIKRDYSSEMINRFVQAFVWQKIERLDSDKPGMDVVGWMEQGGGRVDSNKINNAYSVSLSHLTIHESPVFIINQVGGHHPESVEFLVAPLFARISNIMDNHLDVIFYREESDGRFFARYLYQWRSQIGNRIIKMAEQSDALFGAEYNGAEYRAAAFDIDVPFMEHGTKIRGVMYCPIDSYRTSWAYRIWGGCSAVFGLFAFGVVGMWWALYRVRARWLKALLDRQKAIMRSTRAHESLRVTLGAVNDAVVTINRQGKITDMNRSGEQLFAVSLDDVTHQGFGDSADNIQGIKGIGKKTAATLIAKFGSIDAILAEIESVKPVRHQVSLRAGCDILNRNKKMVALDLGVSIPDDASLFNPWINAMNSTEFRDFCDMYDLKGLKKAEIAVQQTLF